MDNCKNKTLSLLSRYLQGKSRKLLLFAADVFCFLVAELLFLLMANISHSTELLSNPLNHFFNTLILFVLMFFFRLLFGVYRNIWRYTSTKAYFNMVLADCFGGLLALIVSRIFHFYHGFLHAVIVASLSALAALMARFCYRLIYKRLKEGQQEYPRLPIAIIGAGQLGVFLANDLRTNPKARYAPRFFVDVDNNKIGAKLVNLNVYGSDSAAELIERYAIKEVVIAIVNIESEQLSKLFYFYQKLGCNVKVYDSLISADRNKPSSRRIIRDFSVEDLLFRTPTRFNQEEVKAYYAGKTVLITGGGGSIGSELCRQIATCEPKKLIIFDIYENNAYEIEQELRRRYAEALDFTVEIGSVRDVRRLERVFATYRPDVVFHAAAHKHVPLMEHSAGEAVKNNVMGTYNTANMAEKYGVEKFVLVSTDKAVNPTNIMGASKRMCEMVIQCRTDSNTCFSAVRFGNVLGSNGSVIPLFMRQIAAGGPVTITDKRVRRFFMTIPEASQLVIQAGSMAKKGELFVLKMGKPVEIYDLAVNMIRLSGYEPGVDIQIEEVGLRPGEKLYEELLMKTELQIKTSNELIFIEKDTPLSREDVEEKLRVLNSAAEAFDNGDTDAVKQAIAQVVPTYAEPDVVNAKAHEAEEMKEKATV